MATPPIRYATLDAPVAGEGSGSDTRVKRREPCSVLVRT